MRNRVLLNGCAPEPLIHYLKALGIFRLVSEQFDADVPGAWRGNAFVLETEKTADELVAFFLNQYSPTPIVAPWNGGSGFYPQDMNQRATIETLYRIVSPRLDDYRTAIDVARATVSGRSEQPKDEEKADLLRHARRVLSDRALKWLDAAYVLGDLKPDYPPVLGSGGNDGRLDFTINFISRLLVILPEAIRQDASEQFRRQAEQKQLTDSKLAKLKSKIEQQQGQQLMLSEEQLRAALFLDRSAKLVNAAVGQFHPAGAGGANASQGVSGESFVNPWDFVLAIEGTLVLASATVRQLAAGARSKASFPFTARNSSVGYGTAVDGEKMRAEMWLPIWSRPASFAEVAHIFSEGRVQFSGQHRREARTGFDFARAVAELGVDRGIDAFVRYGFIERNGQANLAIPLGCFEVRERPRASLIYEVDRWMDRMRRATRDARRTPPRFVRARTSIENAIFNLCASGEAEHLRATLIALGSAETDLARSPRFRDEQGLRPLAGLTERWAVECDDNSSEFELATGIASITDEGKRGPFRTSIEPIEITKAGVNWTSDDAGAVWSTASLANNLAAVLHRRSIDARTAGASHPAMSSKRFASLAAIDLFLRAETDDWRIEELLRGLALIDWSAVSARSTGASIALPPTLPRAYALLKLLFLPDGKLSRVPLGEPVTIRHEPSIVPLLRAGRITDALETAERRLRSSGLVPFSSQLHFPEDEGARLAAGLLVPIGLRSIASLAALVLRPVVPG